MSIVMEDLNALSRRVSEKLPDMERRLKLLSNLSNRFLTDSYKQELAGKLSELEKAIGNILK